jgi:CheY-like chemotaxis protein
MLPAKSATLAVTEFPSVGERRRGSGTILVVDDEQTVRIFAQQALEHNGYRVLLAENGEEAIEVLAAHPEVVAVLLDLTMPDISGDEVARHLRSIRPSLPILLSSGYSEAEARERFGAAEVTSFLEKPYRAVTLLEKLSALG